MKISTHTITSGALYVIAALILFVGFFHTSFVSAASTWVLTETDVSDIWQSNPNPAFWTDGGVYSGYADCPGTSSCTGNGTCKINTILGNGYVNTKIYTCTSSGPVAVDQGCGAQGMIIGINCQAGEPIPVDCSPEQRGWQNDIATTRICPSNGWSNTQNWGYCNADATCAAATPQACTASNACGQSNTGTINGSGACSVSAPALPSGYGSACTSAANSCGMTNSGAIQCNGSCSAAAPLESLCTAPSTCDARSGQACQSGFNNCGNRNSGSYSCGGICSAATPVDDPACNAPPAYSQSTYAPSGCGTPSATLTATPSRVRSGQTTTLTLTATGVTTSCTVTGPGVNSTTAASSCGVSKTIVTPAITSQVTYKVTCDSSVDLAKIIVNLVPKVIEF